MAKLIEAIKTDVADLSVQEIDVTEHPEMAVKYRVMFTPAIAINGRLAFTGVPREADLRRALVSS